MAEVPAVFLAVEQRLQERHQAAELALFQHLEDWNLPGQSYIALADRLLNVTGFREIPPDSFKFLLNLTVEEIGCKL